MNNLQIGDDVITIADILCNRIIPTGTKAKVINTFLETATIEYDNKGRVTTYQSKLKKIIVEKEFKVVKSKATFVEALQWMLASENNYACSTNNNGILLYLYQVLTQGGKCINIAESSTKWESSGILNYEINGNWQLGHWVDKIEYPLSFGDAVKALEEGKAVAHKVDSGEEYIYDLSGSFSQSDIRSKYRIIN